ncbi:MAG: hypothetical protein AAF456_08985, partial [Planctomycetota bacterium]
RDEKRGVDVSSYGNIPRPQSTRWQLGRLAYWMLAKTIVMKGSRNMRCTESSSGKLVPVRIAG